MGGSFVILFCLLVSNLVVSDVKGKLYYILVHFIIILDSLLSILESLATIKLYICVCCTIVPKVLNGF